MSREKWIGHLVILVTAILFGLNIPIAKSLMPDYFAPMAVTALRMSFAAAAFWATSLFLPQEKVTRKDLFLLFRASFFGIFLNQSSFIMGLSTTSPVDASIIGTTSPLLVMVIAAIFLKEPITLKKAGGVLLGLGGALFLIYSQLNANGGASSSSLLGNLLCLAGSSLYAVYLVMTRNISSRYSSVTLMKWMFLFAALLILPFSWGDIVTSPAFVERAPTEQYLRLFYVLFCATYLTYMLLPMGLKRIRATTVGMYNYLQPFIASMVAIMAGQDHLTWEKPLAGVVIFAGVYLVTISKSREDVVREAAESKALKRRRELELNYVPLQINNKSL